MAVSPRRRPTAALALVTAVALALPPATPLAAPDGPPVSTAKKKAKKKKKKKCRKGYVLKKVSVKIRSKAGTRRKRRTRRVCRKKAAPKRIVQPGPAPNPGPSPTPQTDWAAILTQGTGQWFQTWNSQDPICYLHRFSQSGALRIYSRTDFNPNVVTGGCQTGLGLPSATGTWTVSGNTLTLSINAGISTDSHQLNGYDSSANRISRTRLPPGAGSAPWCGGGALSCPP